MIIGIDCGIRALAVARGREILLSLPFTGLGLSSPVEEYMRVAQQIHPYLLCLSKIRVDWTAYAFKARKGQEKMNALFIGAILASSSCPIYLVEPVTVRRSLGLSAKAKKEEVWEAFSRQYFDILLPRLNEHERDALVLSNMSIKEEE